MDTQPTAPTVQPPVDHDAKQIYHKSSKHLHIPIYLSIIFLIVSFLGGLFLATGYFQTQLENNNSSIKTPDPEPSVVVPGKLVVGIDPTLPPMEYLENGEMIGYDVDLANALAKELGTTVEFKQIVFDDLFAALEQKEIDMIISAVTITEERQQTYDFSEQYLNAGQIIITRKDDTSISSTVDLQGKKIGVQKGTTNETEALKYTAESLVIRYTDFELATKSLVDGTVDAIFTDLPNAKGITLANPELKIATDPFTNEYYGIVFRKGEPMVETVNDALSSLRVKGVLTDLKQKWLD